MSQLLERVVSMPSVTSASPLTQSSDLPVQTILEQEKQDEVRKSSLRHV